MKRPSLSRIAAVAAFLGASLTTFHALAEPEWIWLSKNAKNGEKVTLRREFEIQGDVKSATLEVTCDNGATALLNGQKALENPDWQKPSKADVKALLKAGKNELRLDARNQTGSAAAVAVLTIETADGKTTKVETNADWQAAPAGSSDFKPAVVIAKYGAGPWGKALEQAGKSGDGKVKRGVDNSITSATDPAEIHVPDGFKVELLYTVPKAEQGSWVSMTVDKKGRLLCGDQYGAIYRLTPPPLGTKEQAKVEKLDVAIGGAHGLLYAHDSLYVMVNERGAPEAKGLASGLYRLKDKDGDDHFESPALLSECQGGGEHGPHSMQLSPDGKSIFFNCGNHTKLPENLAISRAAMKSWDEDHILPRMWDGNGHARGILAPGGYICKTDPEGKKVELFCSGFRNEFDFAFDANGELFAYDADMEWDIGAPWYRPTRINHCVSGGEYGWRSGAGKWPAYYEDSLPAVVDIGPGSPTGVVFGTGAKFPAKYQLALYGNDWTYGTMYAVHFTPDGASFKGVKEEFISAKPLPLTDVVINQHDGAMYFGIGGRRAQSGVYRVTYTGKESTAPAKPYAPTPEMKQRHEIEKLHEKDAKLPGGTVAMLLEQLGNKDRFIRFAARVALEQQPMKFWGDLVGAGKSPQAIIEGEIAAARMLRDTFPNFLQKEQTGGKLGSGTSSTPTPPMPPNIEGAMENFVERLGAIDFKSLDLDLQLQLLRAYQIVFARMGKPDAATCAKVAAHLDPLYPSANPLVNRELSQILIFTDSKSVVAKTLGLVATARDDAAAIASDELLARNPGYARAAESAHASRPNLQQIALMYSLRNARAGWTPELKKTFFSWFPRTREWHGGNSFPKFMDNIRTEALANFVTDPAERTALDELSKKALPAAPANVVMPKGPGKAYTTDDIVALTQGGLHKRDFAQGKAMYAATLCARCHHFNGEGGNIGPDLTGAGNRYTMRDLAENIIEPSKVISDQYGTDQIELKDGGLVVGRVVVEENGKLFVMTNPFTPDELTAIPSENVKGRTPFNVSMMPPGLINTLNKDELLDLIAFLVSGGNANDKAFQK
jgi:putative heme-binding domain-containing protein